MTEKLYGGRTPLTRQNCPYSVIQLKDSAILIRVYHTNRNFRRVLKNNARDPSFFLKPDRLKSYETSIEAAKNWLVKTASDHRPFFGRGLVEFVFV